MTTDRQYRDLARRRYSRANGDVEITNNAQVSPVGDAGRIRGSVGVGAQGEP